jgi:heme exporter protein C
LRAKWWKILAVLFLLYTLGAGFLFKVPRLPILHETIRNLYFHVPMWFSMIILFSASLVYSIRFLMKEQERDDVYALELVNTGLLFGLLGLATGSLWAKYTWGDWWSSDPKQLFAAILVLEYLAYLVLRGSMTEEKQRAKISAVYNLFAAASMIPLLFILPRLTSSLHPGNGGNPGFNAYDLDNNMRLVFYPAVIGWALLGVWLASLRIRTKLLLNEVTEDE